MISQSIQRLSLTTKLPDSSHFVSAHLTSNKFKNRLVNVLPCKSSDFVTVLYITDIIIMPFLLCFDVRYNVDIKCIDGKPLTIDILYWISFSCRAHGYLSVVFVPKYCFSALIFGLAWNTVRRRLISRYRPSFHQNWSCQKRKNFFHPK